MTKNKIQQLSKGRPAAVFGAGLSGAAAAMLLEKSGVECAVYASGGEEFTAEKARKHALAVYSPAFRPDHPWISAAEQSGVECICEPDLASLAWSGKIIAITGTNGKTTLTSFIAHALRENGSDAVAAGNIGLPLSRVCAESAQTQNRVAVCELSSFQTARLKYLRPDALAWTNFDADHLDWHKDLREYFEAKFNLVKALRRNVFAAGSSVQKFAEKFGAQLPPFAKIFREESAAGAPPPFDSSVQSKNFGVAMLLWEALGFSREGLESACRGFALPRYRFSKPEIVGGVKFYNDSKATNAHAAIAALNEIAGEKNAVWIGGGKDKLCEIESLANAVSQSCKCAMLIGQTAEKLKRAFDAKNFKSKICATLGEAVESAFSAARPGGSVIFSPGFSSFGMFSGYAERGKFFDDAVLCLKNSEKTLRI